MKALLFDWFDAPSRQPAPLVRCRFSEITAFTTDLYEGIMRRLRKKAAKRMRKKDETFGIFAANHLKTNNQNTVVSKFPVAFQVGFVHYFHPKIYVVPFAAS
uniref:Uncharacterized protein n=1 Tax=Steinernema glaseri TaxID=37863 RepID=A0A1I7ZY97_9BILA